MKSYPLVRSAAAALGLVVLAATAGRSATYVEVDIDFNQGQGIGLDYFVENIVQARIGIYRVWGWKLTAYNNSYYAVPFTALCDVLTNDWVPGSAHQIGPAVLLPPNASHGAPQTAFSSVPTALEDASGRGTGMSRNSEALVGFHDTGAFTPYHAFRWMESTGYFDLGTLDPANNASRSSFATDVSSDGSVVVGYSHTVGGATVHAFRWTAAGGMEDLGSGAGPTGYSSAFGVSADGSVIVGESDFPGGFSGTVTQAFRWTQAGGFQKLGALATDFPSVATAINADGSVVVGVSGVEVVMGNSSINGARAFRWTQTSGMENLSAGLGNTTSAATDVSDDGAIVVGIFDPSSNTGSFLPNQGGGRFPFGSSNRAFQWTASTGSADLNQLLATAGANLGGATIVAASAISPDGIWIAAHAVTPASGPGETSSVLASLTYTVPPPSRLLNLSTRGLAQSGDNVLIPGFVVSGTANKRLLIRAVGPTLSGSPFNLGNAVAPDPQLTLKRLNTAVQPPVYVDIAANDDWGANSNAADITTTAANLFAFPLGNAKEAALLRDLVPGQYTITAGPSASSGPAINGIMIVELYDANDYAVDSRLINISTRGFCGVGAQVMIPGFVVSSESPRTVLVRVVGPTLGTFNVGGTMVDPKLEVFPGGASAPIFTNDNWGDNPTAATTTAQIATQVGAFALTAGSKDAALVVTLPPGNFTVVGSSAIAGGTGVVLVEVYVVP